MDEEDEKSVEIEDGDEFVPMSLHQQYRHTVKLGKTTSRMSNKDWYKSALELEVQLHCYVWNESRVDCYLYISSEQKYEEVGLLDLKTISGEDGAEEWMRQMREWPSIQGAKALGVIFYLADDISTAILGGGYQEEEDLEGVRELLHENVKEVLEDKTVSDEKHAWGLFPYPGHGKGDEFSTAVAVSRKWEPLMRRLRAYGDQNNFPVRTRALSAPLCAVHSLPWCAEPSPRGIVGLYCYEGFTIFTLFNREGDLELLRHVPHAQGARSPRNIGPSIFSAAMAYELENPDIYVFAQAGQSMDSVTLSLQAAMKESQVMLVNVVEILQSRGVTIPIPLEMLTTTQEQDPEVYPLAASETFSLFREEGWPVQDFYEPLPEEVAMIPDEGSMKILKLGYRLRGLIALFFIAVLSYSGFQIWKDVMSETWQYSTGKKQVQLSNLQKEIANYQKVKEFFKPRSKAWDVMEFISSLVGDDGSMRLKSVNYEIKKAATTSDQQGLEKVWEIEGWVNEKGLQRLEDYNLRDGKKISALFEQVAKSTGNSFYLPHEKGRDLLVEFSRKKVNSRGEGGRFPYSFHLIITQSFSSEDPIIIH